MLRISDCVGSTLKGTLHDSFLGSRNITEGQKESKMHKMGKHIVEHSLLLVTELCLHGWTPVHIWAHNILSWTGRGSCGPTVPWGAIDRWLKGKGSHTPLWLATGMLPCSSKSTPAPGSCKQSQLNGMGHPKRHESRRNRGALGRLAERKISRAGTG